MTREKISETLYLFGLCLLVAAMPLSVFMMSISQFALIGSWLISGNIINKIKSAFNNPVVAVLALVYFMHLVGGFYSTDYNYYFNDVRIKLPLLILPVLIYTSPKISQQWFERILSIFVLAVLLSTLISMGVLYHIIPLRKQLNDIRDISVFVSHIRLSLFICLSIFITCFFIQKHFQTYNFLKNILLILLIVWFLIFLFILEAMTGVSILIIVSLFLAVYFIYKQKKFLLKVSGTVIVLIIPLLIFGYLKHEAKKIYRAQKVEYNQLDMKTLNGNDYEHYIFRTEEENGNLMWIYICPKELSSAWNQRSKLSYEGHDLRENELKFTLIRFLTSKGLRKDSVGVYALNDNEIHAVENGIANVNYQNMGNMNMRLHRTIMEYYSYKNAGNPSGNSVLQRMEYWKAGWNIFLQNFWMGVGTGDVQKAFDNEYERGKSRLSKEYRHRAHNQFLTFAVTFGVFGFLFFMFSLFYPIFKLKKHTDYFYAIFFIIAFISMFTEDTLETQAGVTFFAFFNSFLLFSRSGRASG
ncbi:MAG: O-antigen ligase family protein [Bacteroidota bacterium]